MKINKTVFAFTATALVLGLASVAGVARGGGAPDQPHMTAALGYLETAKSELQAAEADKGGHREKAIDYTSEAISETRLGIDAGADHAILAAPVSLSPDQPHMQAALNALNNAKNELKMAIPDKGGHRVNAIKLVSSAISETKSGISFARH